MSLMFFFNNIMLGTGLAMDAFSVSLANGLNEPRMKKSRMVAVAGLFAIFQFGMPLFGWAFVTSLVQYFKKFEKMIPWIALILLLYIGGKMLFDGIKEYRQNGADTTEEMEASEDSACEEAKKIGVRGLLLQGIATSIDALSVGFTIARYNIFEAILASLIIGIVTYFICFFGLAIGKKAGLKLAGKAGILGGIILIAIGIEIFITGIF